MIVGGKGPEVAVRFDTANDTSGLRSTPDNHSHLPKWAVGLIVCAAVICAVVLIGVLLVVYVRKRSAARNTAALETLIANS